MLQTGIVTVHFTIPSITAGTNTNVCIFKTVTNFQEVLNYL